MFIYKYDKADLFSALIVMSYIISFARSLRVYSEIDLTCLSVCTTIFKRIAGLCLYLKMLIDFSHELYKRIESYFQIANLFSI